MVVLEEFYQITQAQPKHVSGKWKILHVTIFVFTGLFSFIASFSCGQLLSQFLYNCIIDANIIFSGTEKLETQKFNISSIDLTFSSWGPNSTCNFVQFTPLVSMIASVVWGCFFIIIGKGGAGYSNDKLQSPWKIVYPCIFFSFIMTVTFLASTITMSVGLHKFCNILNSQFNGTSGCTPNIDYFTLQFCETKQNFYLAAKMIEIGNFTAIVGWCGQLALLILRVCSITDYKIHLVRIIEEDVVFQPFALDDEDNESDTESFLISEIPTDVADDSL